MPLEVVFLEANLQFQSYSFISTFANFGTHFLKDQPTVPEPLPSSRLVNLIAKTLFSVSVVQKVKFRIVKSFPLDYRKLYDKHIILKRTLFYLIILLTLIALGLDSCLYYTTLYFLYYTLNNLSSSEPFQK